jgi:phage replication O-like protein O
MALSNVIQFVDMNKKSPQKENGYTPIANELLEQFISFNFSKRQLSVVLSVVRMTYGYNKKQDSLSGWQIAEMTKIDRSHVSKTINELVLMNVLIKHEEGRNSHGVFINEISINKDYSQWLTVADSATVAKTAPLLIHGITVAKTATVTVADSATQPLPKQPTHKDIKTIKETKEKDARKLITLKTYLENCKAENIKPIPEDDAVFNNAEESKIPLDFLRLGWLSFRDEFLENEDKKQKCWLQTFRNYVRNDYLKVWAFNKAGECYLTAKGTALNNRYGVTA